MHILCFSVMQTEARDLKTELGLEVLCCVSPESNTHICILYTLRSRTRISLLEAKPRTTQLTSPCLTL